MVPIMMVTRLSRLTNKNINIPAHLIIFSLPNSAGRRPQILGEKILHGEMVEDCQPYDQDDGSGDDEGRG